MAQQEDILTKTYDLLLYLIPLLSKLPRSHKFTLGDRIENLLLDVLQAFIQAYYTGNRTVKRERLRENNLRLETLRYLIRLIHDLDLISNKRYGLISERVDEIGRMTGGWLKSEARRTRNSSVHSVPPCTVRQTEEFPTEP